MKEEHNNIYLIISEVRRFINKKIIIYGAGIYGTILFSFLKMEGLKDNVICFAVSDRKGNQESIFGKSVLRFEDVDIDNDETVIFVAMNEKNAGSVIEKLKRKGIKNVYWFPEKSFVEARQEMKRNIFNKYSMYPIQKNKVFFYCYEGKGYCCSCKYIAEKLLTEHYPVQLVWALASIEDKDDIPKPIKAVITNTEEYFRELYTSSVIVGNNGIDPWIYKREGQYCINTWHGYGPFKKVNAALPKNDGKSMKDYFACYFSYFDLFITASKFYTQVYRESFCYEGEVLECGAPRNDIFFTDNHAKESICNAYSISFDKKILLYAPTFRYDNAAAFDKYSIDMNIVLDAMKKRFGEDYVLLYRFHHQLYKSKERINYFENGIDVTLYPDIQELLAASDIVITDYSSLMWDFSLQRKPVFLYQSDAKEYEDNRGFYAPVSEWPYPQAHTQDELIEVIEHFDEEKYIQELNLFLEKYGSCDDGHASERVVKRIMDVVEQRNVGDND